MAENDGQGITINEVLIDLLKQVSAQGVMLKTVAGQLEQFGNKHDELLQRVTQSETLNGVQDERIAALQRRADDAPQEREALKRFQWMVAGGLSFLSLLSLVLNMRMILGVLQ